MWLVENWMVAVMLTTAICVIGALIYRFMKMPTQEQINTIKEWLIFACTEAEKELGSGTGQLKLRYVWDLFITRFPFAARVISFEMFRVWVDEALEEMRMLLTQNKSIREIVKGEVQ